jgi:hypothetical protein
MLPLSTARRLKPAGLAWTPALHDFFGIPDRGLDNRVFVISDISVDVELLRGQSMVTFNGNAEWALDYIMTTEVVWLPSEAQLREALESHLLAEPQPALRMISAPNNRQCVIQFHGQTATFESSDASEAYATALLYVLEQERNP